MGTGSLCLQFFTRTLSLIQGLIRPEQGVCISSVGQSSGPEFCPALGLSLPSFYKGVQWSTSPSQSLFSLSVVSMTYQACSKNIKWKIPETIHKFKLHTILCSVMKFHTVQLGSTWDPQPWHDDPRSLKDDPPCTIRRSIVT